MRAPFRGLLQEVGASFVGLGHFLDDWRRYRTGHDPSEEFNGDSLTMAIEGDQAHFYPHYDQWGDGVEIWAPLDLVEELIEAYRQWMTRRH